MLRRIAIALVAASLLGAASIPTVALAFGHGVGGDGGFWHGGFGGIGVAHGFTGPGVVGGPHISAGHAFVGHRFGPGFHARRFGVPAFVLGLGLGYGAYRYYDDACYAWTPYGYRWVCGYDY
jgi:hypothetical protein